MYLGKRKNTFNEVTSKQTAKLADHHTREFLPFNVVYIISYNNA